MVAHVLENPRCALFAGMGMGKTVCTLTAIEALLLSGAVRRVLVLGPLRVARTVWSEEVLKWKHLEHLRVIPITGAVSERNAAMNTPADVHTLNYENVQWLENNLMVSGRPWPWDMVVADEATSLKSHRSRQGGKRARSLSLFAFKEVKRWVNLTGTPAPNGLQDLWGQTWFIDQGARLGKSFSAFENRWFGYQRASDAVSHGRNFVKRIPFPHAQADIEAAIKDVCLTVDPKDHFPIDEPTVITVKVQLPPHARAIYRNMEREFFAEIEGFGVEAFNAAGKSIKLLGVANGSCYTGSPDQIEGDIEHWVTVHDEKLLALDSILAECGGVPILVAYHFRPDLVRLLKRYPQARHIKSTIDEADFKVGKIQIGLVHAQSVGHGVDGFQNATNIMVFFGHWWAMEQRLQLIERIGPVRQIQSGHTTAAGRNRPVFLYEIVAENTIDELVIERIRTKRSVQDILLAALKKVKHDGL